MADDVSKAVLITGCSTGIGRATAERLAGKGWTVYATARKERAIEDLKAKGCKTLALDVTDEASMAAAVEDGRGGRGRRRRARQQRRLQPERRGRGPCRWTASAASSRPTSSAWCGCASWCCPACASRAGAGSSTSARWAASWSSPAAAFYHATKHAVEALSDALRFEVAGFGVDVVLIEPGLIKTEFGNTAAGSLGETETDGPYASFNAAVGSATAGAYEGPMAKLGGGPEAVAKKIEKALSSRRPKTRYRVTPSAHMVLNTGTLLTDRGWDRFVGTSSPPKAMSVGRPVDPNQHKGPPCAPPSG